MDSQKTTETERKEKEKGKGISGRMQCEEKPSTLSFTSGRNSFSVQHRLLLFPFKVDKETKREKNTRVFVLIRF